VTVLVLDRPGFKHINDVGYLGDRVLQAVASRLKDLAEQVNGQVASHGAVNLASCCAIRN
jgi:GGDEF domain-containing protein